MSGLRSVGADDRLTHVCSVCGKRAEWTEKWSWYGSLCQLEDRPESVIKVCSASCRAVSGEYPVSRLTGGLVTRPTS